MATCMWIKVPNHFGDDGTFVPATYCGEETSYRMVPDGGEPGASLVREHEVFCPEHKTKAEADYVEAERMQEYYEREARMAVVADEVIIRYQLGVIGINQLIDELREIHRTTSY